MSTANHTLVYQKISKICGIAIPIIYLVAFGIIIGGIAITYLIIFGSGPLEINNSFELELSSLSTVSRGLIVIGNAFILFFLLRFIWFVLHVTKQFKVGRVFEYTTAENAQSAAWNLLFFQVSCMLVSAYCALLAGNIKISLPDGIASIVFVYLFAWVIRIGSQLKAENDLTV